MIILQWTLFLVMMCLAESFFHRPEFLQPRLLSKSSVTQRIDGHSNVIPRARVSLFSTPPQFSLQLPTSRQNILSLEKTEDIDINIDKDKQSKQKRSNGDDFDGDWRLILHNDDEHSIDEAQAMIKQVVSEISFQRALDNCYETHTMGSSIVAIGPQKLMEKYAEALQMMGLSMSVCPDEEFNDSQDLP